MRSKMSMGGCIMLAMMFASIGCARLQETERPLPFAVERVAEFDTPWGLAFLPDGRMLVTEKHKGRMWLVTQRGVKTAVANVPPVVGQGQNGLLDVAPHPAFTDNGQVYFTLIAPSEEGTRLVLLRAELKEEAEQARLDNLAVLWQQTPAGGGGQPGGVIVFDMTGDHLYLSVGDRMRPDSAQDRDAARGKVLRLNPDGATPDDNPQSMLGGMPGQTWTSGHRNPYGLAFAPDGALWSHEMGPRGGDELNLIEAGKNYGWPLVSNGSHYNFMPIPDHDARPEFTPPVLSWTPVISPAGLVFYQGNMFPDWRGTALIGGLSSQSLIHLRIYGRNQAHEVARWSMNARIRNIALAADGAVWLIEDSRRGGLLRLTPLD